MRAVTGELAPGDVSGRRARRTTAVADDEHGLVRVGRDGTGHASGQAAAEPGPATRAEDDEARLVMSRPLRDEPRQAAYANDHRRAWSPPMAVQVADKVSSRTRAGAPRRSGRPPDRRSR